jgi:hypothetical protein
MGIMSFRMEIRPFSGACLAKSLIYDTEATIMMKCPGKHVAAGPHSGRVNGGRMTGGERNGGRREGLEGFVMLIYGNDDDGSDDDNNHDNDNDDDYDSNKNDNNDDHVKGMRQVSGWSSRTILMLGGFFGGLERPGGGRLPGVDTSCMACSRRLCKWLSFICCECIM